MLTTGSDEHGVNVERAAERAGKTPKEFCDVIAARIRAAVADRSASQIDYFQRTTSPQHATRGAGAVRALPRRTATSTKALTPANTASSTTSTSTTPSPATPAPIAAGPPKPSPKRISSSSFRRFTGQAARALRVAPGFHPARNAPQRSDLLRARRASPIFPSPAPISNGASRWRAKRRTCSTCGSTR